MPTASLYGTIPTNWTSEFGGSPAVPTPGATAATAISGNIGNLGQLYNMAGGINAFQNRQALQNLQANLPDYSAMVGQSSRNILQNLQGQVSGDVINNLLRQAGERGITTGQGAPGPNTNAAYLGALGLTSIGLQQTAEQQLTNAIARTPQAAPMNLSPFLVTADQAQQAQAAANLYAAAPNPQAAARAREAAALRGVQAGAGAVGGARIPQGGPANSWWGNMGGGPAQVVANSLATDVSRPTNNISQSDWWRSIGWTGQQQETPNWWEMPIDELASELGLDEYPVDEGPYGMMDVAPSDTATGYEFPTWDFSSDLFGDLYP